MLIGMLMDSTEKMKLWTIEHIRPCNVYESPFDPNYYYISKLVLYNTDTTHRL